MSFDRYQDETDLAAEHVDHIWRLMECATGDLGEALLLTVLWLTSGRDVAELESRMDGRGPVAYRFPVTTPN